MTGRRCWASGSVCFGCDAHPRGLDPSGTRHKPSESVTVPRPDSRTEGPPVSDPAPCPDSSTCVSSCKRCMRILTLMFAGLLVAALLAACLLGMIVRDIHNNADPDPQPTPTPTASADPSPGSPEPSSPPTGGNGGATGEPTSPGEPTPSDPGGCNIFDPECGGASGGASEGGEG
ncbi:membrane protein [Streptomyces phage Gilgamesh]|uniref:Membrane protein n=1 Tax=Streptomyces phage Gilgamesh TaxID=2599890 RepID=A0A5J6TTS8_9CAUD|nr:membrane protein [Streptomyces phage Gilgamesh]QFG13337.1 membrane protein [Streptomyces phage Gilgamesh]